MRLLKPFWDEQKIPSSLPPWDFFFHLFSAPKFSPLLPTTYQPLPPSLHRQSSRNIERERAWSRSCWSRCLELGGGARSFELCLESEWDLRVIEVSLFFFFFLFFNFFLLRSAASFLPFFSALQCSEPFFLFLFVAMCSNAASFFRFFGCAAQ